MKPALWLSCLCLAVSPGLVGAQPREAVVIFKDGFSVRGKVVQKKDFIVDPATGASVSIPAGNSFVYVDDVVRRIHFTPSQVQDVIDVKPEQLEKKILFHMKGTTSRGAAVPRSWVFESISDWTVDKWDRVIKVKTEFGRLELVQRITDITPQWIIGLTVANDRDFAYLTREFGYADTRKLVQGYLANQGSLKENEHRLILANFLRQAGWLDAADKELENLVEHFPEQQDAVKSYRIDLHRQQGDLFAEGVERMYHVGQHDAAQERLDVFTKDDESFKALSDKNRLTILDLKKRYEDLTGQLVQVRLFLKEFSKHGSDRELWVPAIKLILGELNLDTVSRLKTFAEFRVEHARELKEERKPSQRTDEVLALAVTGWLQDDGGAEPDPKLATKLFRAREFLIGYLGNDSAGARARDLASFTKKNDLPIDVLIRLIRLLPPAEPYAEKLDADGPTKLSIDLPDSDGGTYFVKLPPEYHPQRSYPVVMLLQSNREKPETLMKRWQAEAAQHGFIMVAPRWGGKAATPVYDYSRAEHAIVLDTLRDLRRRFNVDSDRVFLFGWEQGASAAFDIGLSHPDQFAGVLPMNGAVRGFPAQYWPNAQYLPFYVVEGDRDGSYPKETRMVFKDWIRGHYPSIYVEYKGRSSEWFGAELAPMMDWMSRKKRHHPLKEMGRYHTGGGAGMGEEFKTMRACDNRFYWLSTDDIGATHINQFHGWSAGMRPATLQANVSVGNESSIKGGARIWTQFYIRAYGIKQVSLWLAPNQIDFSKDVLIRVNTQMVGGYRKIAPSLQTLLEELYVSGDRQRLFVAKIDLRLETSRRSLLAGLGSVENLEHGFAGVDPHLGVLVAEGAA